MHSQSILIRIGIFIQIITAIFTKLAFVGENWKVKNVCETKKINGS